MKLQVALYRYGSPRLPHEGIRIGAARHVPRGVRREDWQRLNYFDLWVPLLAPSSDLVAAYRHHKIGFVVFGRRYEKQMKASECRQMIGLLAGMALFQPICVGCFCEDESHCHRTILRRLIITEAKKKIGGFSLLPREAPSEDPEHFASPVCYLEDLD